MTEIFYIHGLLLTDESYGTVVGKSLEYDAQINQLRESNPDSLDELLDARLRGTRRLKPEELPKAFYVERRKKIPNIFRITDGVTVVSEPMKSILQKLDPGVHQFFPIKIIDSEGVEVLDPYFIFHFFTHKNALREGQVAIEDRSYNGIEYRMLNTAKIHTNLLQLYPSSMEGAHFWRSEKFPNIYFVSKELLVSVEDAGFPFYQTYPVEII